MGGSFLPGTRCQVQDFESNSSENHPPHLERGTDIRLSQAATAAVARAADEAVRRFPPGKVHTHLLENVERELLRAVIVRCGGNLVHAADLLGVHRNTVRKKLKAFGLYHITTKTHRGGWKTD